MVWAEVLCTNSDEAVSERDYSVILSSQFERLSRKMLV